MDIEHGSNRISIRKCEINAHLMKNKSSLSTRYLVLSKSERKTIKNFHQFIKRTCLPHEDANNPIRWQSKANDQKMFTQRFLEIITKARSSEACDNVKFFACLGFLYAMGWCGLDQDRELAIEYFKKGMDYKDTAAYLIYAHFLKQGLSPFP